MWVFTNAFGGLEYLSSFQLAESAGHMGYECGLSGQRCVRAMAVPLGEGVVVGEEWDSECDSSQHRGRSNGKRRRRRRRRRRREAKGSDPIEMGCGCCVM